MKVKQLVAGVLTTVVMLGQLLPGLSTVAAKEADASTGSLFNKEGLWLTEIY